MMAPNRLQAPNRLHGFKRRLTLCFVALASFGVASQAVAKSDFPGRVNTWCDAHGRLQPIAAASPTSCETCHMPGTFNKRNVFQPEFDRMNEGRQLDNYSWFCNEPPALDPIGNQTIDEGGMLAFLIRATDVDIDPQRGDNTQTLTLNGSDLPLGSTFTDHGDGSADFNWMPQPGQAGSYPVIFTVVDDAREIGSDSQQVALTVGAGNRPPTLDRIGNRAAREGERLAFSVRASEPDGDPLSLIAANLPTGADFVDRGDGSADFSWTPGFDQAGNYPVMVTATDGGDPAASASETFTISVGDVNRPPVLATIGNRSTDEGVELAFPLTATDPDGDDLSFSAGNLPTGSELIDNGNGSADFRWTPGFDQSGNTTVTFTVTDAGDPMASDSEQVTISVGAVNRPPELGTIGNRTVQAERRIAITLTATDPDGDGLAFSVANPPEGSTFTDRGNGMAEFSWTPRLDQVGNHSVTFSVIDDFQPMESDFEEIVITVTEGAVNRPPMLDLIGSRVVNAADPLVVPITASDPDGDGLVFTALGLPAGAELLDAGQGAAELFWTPGFDQVGNYSVTVTVADDGTPSESDSEGFTITVGVVNRPPVLDPIGNRTTQIDQPVTIVFTARDPDGRSLRCELVPVPPGASFADNGNGTAELHWIPGVAQVGDHQMTLTVYDGGVPMEMDSETFAVTVEMPDQEPPTGDVSIGRARWKVDKARLDLKGRSEPRVEVDVLDADSGALLGKTRANGAGKWNLHVRPVVVPCAVQARVGLSYSAPAAVQNAPETCGEAGLASLRVKDAEWKCEKRELRLKGDHAPSRAAIAVYDSDSGAPLGDTSADRKGNFRYRGKVDGRVTRVDVGVVRGDEVWLSGPFDVDNADKGCDEEDDHDEEDEEDDDEEEDDDDDD